MKEIIYKKNFWIIQLTFAFNAGSELFLPAKALLASKIASWVWNNNLYECKEKSDLVQT